MAKKNNETNIDFYCENYFHSSSYKKTDLIICADVYEHIEDYIGFLKKLVTGGEFFLFNIPLDVCLRSLLDNRVFSENYKNAGHLHFYNKHVAKLILNHCNYEIIDTIYAKSFLTHVKIDSIKKMIYYIPMKFFDLINEDLSASLFGHYSLVVLAKRSKENNIK